MSCSCNTGKNNASCTTNKKYMMCYQYTPSPITEYFSYKFENLEGNYPLNRSKCVDYGTNPRYYNAVHKPCNCQEKCYSK